MDNMDCPLRGVFCPEVCEMCPLKNKLDLAERIRKIVDRCKLVVRKSDVDLHLSVFFGPVTVEADGKTYDGFIELGYLLENRIAVVSIRTHLDAINVLSMMDENIRVEHPNDRSLCYSDGGHRVCIHFATYVQKNIFLKILPYVPVAAVYTGEDSKPKIVALTKVFDLYQKLGQVLPGYKVLETIRAIIYNGLVGDCVYSSGDPEIRQILRKLVEISLTESARKADILLRMTETVEKLKTPVAG